MLAGPARDGEGIVTSDLDLDDIARRMSDLDVVGHYARPVQLTVDECEKRPVDTITAGVNGGV